MAESVKFDATTFSAFQGNISNNLKKIITDLDNIMGAYQKLTTTGCWESSIQLTFFNYLKSIGSSIEIIKNQKVNIETYLQQVASDYSKM